MPEAPTGSHTGAQMSVAGLRVALVLATSAGGVGRHVRSVAAGLASRGARVIVLGPASTQELFDFTATGARFAPVEIADRPRPASDARAVARLRRLLKGADVVHAHGLRAGGLAVAAAARVTPGPLRLQTGGPPLVVTLHNAVIAGGMVGAGYGVLERIVARGATMVLTVSPDLEERMRALRARSVGRAIVAAPPSKPQSKDTAGDAAAAKSRVEIRAEIRTELAVGDRPVVLTVARLAEQKGLSTLLDAAAGWGRREPPPLVVVAGDGPLAGELRARVVAERLPVRLLGHRCDVAELLAAADVAVVPSVWEGQPLIAQEALRAGRPLVATAVGGIPNMVGSDAALLVPAGDAAGLERAVCAILDDPALASRLADAAARRATDLPTEADVVGQLAEIYTELVVHRE